MCTPTRYNNIIYERKLRRNDIGISREKGQAKVKAIKENTISAYANFAQQNIERIDVLLEVADSPLAMKIYLLILQKMNRKNALVASYQFFMDYFKCSWSSVKRAVQYLKKLNVLQVKRSGGATIYLLNPEIVWKDKGSNMKYCEFEGNIVLTMKEWNEEK